MKAFEVMATLNNQKQLLLDDNLDIVTPSRVKVILLVSDEEENNFDDTSAQEIKASLRQSLQEAKEGKKIPVEQMWQDIDE
ncbi:hypothetical protein A5482_008245 [Cyanobacterium sp. IPPAS B-1200]|uniref:type II toxin-antitoxin system RelN family antitoxin n=1 Tax=Cyanobacterium sp. IPPAS B-1200 TaxID=1562720 RepID=UPI00085261E5|nr:hypothetical protein [Cyanobacterium sp. IPPAS B-1200]OEJ79632.1 hypothetical protein A5482_09635 [Cyanobacterium sp. IPPAS B-1200]